MVCVSCIAGTYGSLDLEMVTDYIEAIRGFPALPKPEIFGLHENADITCDQNETYNMFTTILALQPRVSGGAGISREDTILQLCESSADKVAAGICISLYALPFCTLQLIMYRNMQLSCNACHYMPH